MWRSPLFLLFVIIYLFIYYLFILFFYMGIFLFYEYENDKSNAHETMKNCKTKWGERNIFFFLLCVCGFLFYIIYLW